MNFIQKFIDKAKSSPTQLPTRLSILPDHVIPEGKINVSFKERYFQIRINEMFLKDNREWYKKYAPTVFTVSEYNYAGNIETVPFIVGPQMMEKFGKNLPNNMLFLNTRVAGIHPYQGDQITLSVILYQYEVGNYVEKFLHTLESTANVFKIATAFTTYIQIAKVLFEGFDYIMGLDGFVPLMGLRVELDQGELKSGYFTLINSIEGNIDENNLWVKNDQLLYGNSIETAKPFREADYVLYSILHDDERNDLNSLPFYSLWQLVKNEASKPGEDAEKSANYNMVRLNQAILTSPDLTEKQGLELLSKYQGDLEIIKKATKGKSELGEKTLAKTKMDTIRAKSLEFLKKD